MTTAALTIEQDITEHLRAAPATHETVTAALVELGPRPGVIAEALIARGIRGTRENAHECPIAVYLGRRFPEADHIVVGMGGIDVCTGEFDGFMLEYEDQHLNPTPIAPVGKFVRYFDNGVYPDLIDS